MQIVGHKCVADDLSGAIRVIYAPSVITAADEKKNDQQKLINGRTRRAITFPFVLKFSFSLRIYFHFEAFSVKCASQVRVCFRFQ